MSESPASTSSLPAAGEFLSTVEFQQALRRVIRYRQQAPVENPLAAAVARIEQNPALSQSRLLNRMLSALVHQKGEFRRAEITSFDAETFAMVIALMDAFEAGRYTTAEQQLAIEAVHAAELFPGS